MSTSPLDLLLPSLEGVRRTGHGKYVARCPAHGDKHPSLAIRETDDGVLLLHCFAGCSTDEVVGAVGIALSDLFPQRESTGRRSERRPFSANDLLTLAAWESLLASVIANDIAQGIVNDKERLLIAAGRLQHIAEVANVR
jgi:hypothetical protein